MLGDKIQFESVSGRAWVRGQLAEDLCGAKRARNTTAAGVKTTEKNLETRSSAGGGEKQQTATATGKAASLLSGAVRSSET